MVFPKISLVRSFSHSLPPNQQGTGLGLSLAYDITKAHGGEIKVETKEIEGREEFLVQLPNK